ncbi:uncharacterized protein B0I36DRAFT_332501 [Microdochium trichocladiopsis]|uniref:Uncharacterized protein n=1 Tax=Microdochium trichocladiopsis TaxID=1682393 RepID=A0A9P8XYE0_9PEZI|nr:uncharacterized protein B0I36DRAFT_332501 [Microdochium trichocladiopsis]KAH7025083.1 hypothetical protein B0I36DRAFT_332501 [Microdochium trichocladiopsis]
MRIDSTVLTSCLQRVKSAFTPSNAPTMEPQPQSPSTSKVPEHQAEAAQDSELEREILVFVDVPDVDNVLCCLSIIKGYPDRRANIVLAPRPVDFAVKLYPGPDDAQGRSGPVERALFKIIPKLPDGKLDIATMVRRKMTAYTTPPEWVNEIEDEDVLPYFTTPDRIFEIGEGNDKNGLKEDTRLYMKTSAYRIASFLRSRGIPSSRYRLYWDEASMEKIAPGMRHASHVPDYTYGYTKPKKEPSEEKVTEEKVTEEKKAEITAIEELAEHERILQVDNADERRRRLRQFCERYNNAEEEKCKRDGINTILSPFDDLIAEQKQRSESLQQRDWPVMIGGPFTEALKWLQEDLPMTSVTAMACFISGRENILSNQFNVAVDLWSAWQFLDKVKQKNIPTLLVPTECVKAKEWRISKEDLDRAFAGHEDIRTAVEEFTNQSKALESVTLYDWVASIIARDHDMLPTKPILPYLAKEVVVEREEIVDGESIQTKHLETHETPLPQGWKASPSPPELIFKVKPVEPEEGGSVRMCWDDPGPDNQIVRDFHQKVVEEMKKDLEPGSPLGGGKESNL